eukprot:10705235-Alexandrium_andersonii.AAC.1
MVQEVLVRRGLSAFLVASLLQYVEDRVLSVQGLNDRLRPAGLGSRLVPGGPLRREDWDVLFQGRAEEVARAIGGHRTAEWGMWCRVHARLGPRPDPHLPELPSPMEEVREAQGASPSVDLEVEGGAIVEAATWRQLPDPTGIWAASVGGHGWRPGTPVSATTGLTLELAGALRRVFLTPSLLREELPELASRVIWLLASPDGTAVMVILEGVWALSGRVVGAVWARLVELG